MVLFIEQFPDVANHSPRVRLLPLERHLTPSLRNCPACIKSGSSVFIHSLKSSTFRAPLLETFFYSVTRILCVFKAQQIPPHSFHPVAPCNKVFPSLDLITHWSSWHYMNSPPCQTVPNSKRLPHQLPAKALYLCKRFGHADS